MGSNKHLVLYDGECALCHGAVRFSLKRDHENLFSFAALQSETGQSELKRFKIDRSKTDSIILIENRNQSNEMIHVKSKAAFQIGMSFGGFIGALCKLTNLFPRFLTDLGYDIVAKSRKFIFGTKDICELPAPEQRDRFLE